MKVIFPLIAVIGLILIPLVGVSVVGHYPFGVLIPYAALVIFLVGFIYRIFYWASSPVPFRIPTTCGQTKSLPWIKQNKFDNPTSLFAVIVRMALEVLFFRSLFRNTKAELREGPDLVYSSAKWLWLGALAFHWSLLVIILRHYRLFLDPVPAFVQALEAGDGFLQLLLPTAYLTDGVLLAGITYLFLRRIFSAQIRFISLANDYFPLFLIGSIATTGILMRYVFKTDIVSVKALVRGLVTFQFTIPAGVGDIFYIHLFLVSVLAMYFPFSKLMHLGGVFLSPTRNMVNNSREKRHINPWNPDVKIHTYKEYEDDFRDKMKAVGLPLEGGE